MYRSKTTVIDKGVVVAAPSPRVRVIFHNNGDGQKVVLYLGFQDEGLAEKCYQWLVGHFQAYSYKTDKGACKPRPAKRVDGCTWEIKVHRPTQNLVSLFIERDLNR